MKHLPSLLTVVLFLVAALPAQSGVAAASAPAGNPARAVPQEPARDAAQERTGHDGAGSGGHEGGQRALADTPDQFFFVSNFVHLIPHALFGGGGGDGHGHGEQTATTFYNNNLFQLFAVFLILFIFSAVKGSFGGGPTGGFTRVFRGWCHWLRDEVVYSVMGREDGRRWAPFFIYLFFFIAFMNLLGLLPVVGRTATASFYVTGSLACVTFFCMLFFGIREQGVVGYFVNLLPHGLPAPLILLMAPIELVGMFIKPFALMVRLFANMLGGHMVVYAFVGMIFLFAKMMDGNVFYSGLTAIPAVGMSVFINIIEGFIALLQAYVFTYLSVIFVQQAMHPAH